jgi:ribosomal protein S27E
MMRMPPKPFHFKPRDPNLRERGKELTAKVAEFLAPLGFDMVPIAWIKILDCGLYLVILNDTLNKNPTVKIGVFAPPPIGGSGWGQGLNESCMIGILSDTWQRRLSERIGMYETKAEERSKIKCPHCGDFMAERTVKKDGDLKGKSFMGCVRYPDCRGIRAEWKKTSADDDGKYIEVNCPDCQRPLAIRYTKIGQNIGRRFYGCSGYPKCQKIVTEEEAMAIRMMPPPPPPDPFDFTALKKR